VPVAHRLRIEPPDHLPAGHDPVEAPVPEHASPPTPITSRDVNL
jgi:hypothetical protein